MAPSRISLETVALRGLVLVAIMVIGLGVLGVEYCRNNSSGLLLGCWIRQHKFQRFHQAWWATSWRDRLRGMWTGAPTKFATVAGLIGIFAGVTGLMVDLPDLASRL